MAYQFMETPASKYYYGDMIITDKDFNNYLDGFSKFQSLMDGKTYEDFKAAHPKEAKDIDALYAEIDRRMDLFSKTIRTNNSIEAIKQNLYENAETMRQILNILEPYNSASVGAKKGMDPVYKAASDFANGIDWFAGIAMREAKDQRKDRIRSELGLGEDIGAAYAPGQLAKEVQADILYYTTPEKPGFQEMLDHYHSLKTTEEKMRMLYGCAIAMETKPDTSLTEGETNAYNVMLREMMTPLKQDGTLDQAQQEANARALMGLYCEATIKLGADEAALADSFSEQGKSKKAAHALASQTSPWTLESVVGQQLISNMQSDPIVGQAMGDLGIETQKMMDRVGKEVLKQTIENEYIKIQKNAREWMVIPEKQDFFSKQEELSKLGQTIENLSDEKLDIDRAGRMDIDRTNVHNTTLTAIRHFEPAWRKGGANSYKAEAISKLALPQNKINVVLDDIKALSDKLKDTDKFYYINSESYKKMVSSIDKLYAEGEKLAKKAGGIREEDVSNYHKLLNETVRDASKYALDNMNAGEWFNGKKRLNIALTVLNVTNPNAAKEVAGLIDAKSKRTEKVNLDDLMKSMGVGKHRENKDVKVHRRANRQKENAHGMGGM